MQDWSQYIERPYKEVLEELKAEGYQVVGDDLIACYRNFELQKGDARIQLVCVPFDLDDFDEKLNDKERPTSWMMSFGTHVKSMIKKGIY